MSEEASVIDAPAASTQQSGAPESVTWENSPIAQVWNPDGSPREGAQEKLKELGYEDISGFALRNNQGLIDALKSGKEARSMLSKRQEAVENAIIKPGEDASEEDRLAFKASLGALATSEDYAKSMWPDDLPDDFQKDEGLASLVSEWAAKNPINTPEAMKELTQGVIALQQQQQKTLAETHLEESKKEAEAVKATLMAELGGEKAFSDFSQLIGTYLTGPEAVKLGFDVRTEEGEDGKKKYITENPFHAAMLNDPTALRLLAARAKEVNPAKVPDRQTFPPNSQAGIERRKALTAKQRDGSLSQTELVELSQLRSGV